MFYAGIFQTVFMRGIFPAGIYLKAEYMGGIFPAGIFLTYF
jgi:hypothetical protein